MKQKQHSTEEIIRIRRHGYCRCQTAQGVGNRKGGAEKKLDEAMLKNRVLEGVNSKKW